MKNLMELRKTIQTKVGEARALLNGAENRAFTEDEDKQYKDIMTSVEELRGQLQREERLQALEMSDGKPLEEERTGEEKPGGERRFGEFLQRVKRNDPTLMETRSATGQNEAVNEDGGYLVDPQIAGELVKLAQTESMLAGRVKTIPISSNRLVERMIDEDSREDGKRHGGISVYWQGEADKFTASKLKFREVQTGLHKLTGLAYMTDELMEDVPAMEATIRSQFADAYAFKIDDAILNGTGSGEPLGILKGGALVTVPAESGQAAATVKYENILKMWNAMLPACRKNAVWLVSLDMEIQLMQMYMSTGAASGVPVYLPPNGISGSPYGTILGRPVLPLEQCPELGQAGDIVLADLSQYKWIDRGGMKSDVSIHVRFEYGETAFRFAYRCGGRPTWDRKLKAYKGGAERSPFVTLAPRV